jgi:hypothetical protein
MGCPWQPERQVGSFVLERVQKLYGASVASQSWFSDGNSKVSEWGTAARATLRAELDAAFFHLYRLSRNDADFILDQFPVLRRNEEAKHGEFLTKRLVLECYDALTGD